MRSFAKASNKIPRVFIYLLFTLGFFLFFLGVRQGAHLYWFFGSRRELFFRFFHMTWVQQVLTYFSEITWLIIFIYGLLLLILMLIFSVLKEIIQAQGISSKIAGVLGELFLLNGLFFVFLSAYVYLTRGNWIVMYGVLIIGIVSLALSIISFTLRYLLRRLEEKIRASGKA